MAMFLDPSELPSAAFTTELNNKYLQSHHQQMHFQRIVGQRSWTMSLTPSHPNYGKLRFGIRPDELESCYSIRLIGSICCLEQPTWQWGWANDLLPLDLVQDVVETRDQHLSHVPEFQVSKFSLPTSSTMDPQTYSFQLASVCCAHMKQAKAFFTAPDGRNGYVFVAIVDDSFPPPILESLSLVQEIMTVITETDFLTNVPVAIDSFLTFLGAMKLVVGDRTNKETSTTYQYAFPALAVGSIYVTLEESGQFKKISTTK